MKNKITKLLIVLGTACSVSASSFEYISLGFTGFNSHVRDISSDGSTIVGTHNDSAFIWRNGFAQTGVSSLLASAHAVSADGSVITGSLKDGRNYRWENGVINTISELNGNPNTRSHVQAISADGKTLVGAEIPTVSPYVYQSEGIKLQSGVVTKLGDLPGGSFFSQTMGVSSDGSIIVGHGLGDNDFEGLRWENGNMERLGVLSGGWGSFVNNISDDGSTIVGTATARIGGDPIEEGYEAVRWVNAGIQSLGFLPGGTYSQAIDVSADGSIILGRGDSARGERNFLWSEDLGMIELEEYLKSKNVIGVDGYRFQANAISGDGTSIVGIRRGDYNTGNPRESEAFLIRGISLNQVPDESSTLVLLSIFSVFGLMFRRVSRSLSS